MPTYAAIRTSLARMQEQLHEVLSGMDTVQLFARERISIDRYGQLNEINRDLEARAIRAETTQNPILECVPTFTLALLVWFGGNHVALGIISLGSLILFLQYTELLFRPLSALSEQANQWVRATAACQRIFRLLDWQERLHEPSQPIQLPARVQGEVQFRALSFRYQSGPEVLKSVSLTIRAGETLALVGPTGSGKTTLARLLCRLYDAPADSVFLDVYEHECVVCSCDLWIDDGLTTLVDRDALAVLVDGEVSREQICHGLAAAIDRKETARRCSVVGWRLLHG